MIRNVLLALAAIALFSNDAVACGDKFLLVGRGARYQRGYVAVHPGSILLYATTPLTSGRGLRAALKMAGHRVTVASSRADLDAALAGGRFDIVLADSSASTSLTHEDIRGATVVPVLASGAAGKQPAGGKEFCVLKADNHRRNPIAVLDDILAAKLKGTAPACEPFL